MHLLSLCQGTRVKNRDGMQNFKNSGDSVNCVAHGNWLYFPWMLMRNGIFLRPREGSDILKETWSCIL